MQDRYVGDVGDFGKYALLNALTGDSLRLGVIWYLNPTPEANCDGKFTDYPHLESCDPELFRNLRALIEGDRRLTSEIEHLGILPTKLFYREHVPKPSLPCCLPSTQQIQKKVREDWFARAKTAVQKAELLFLDPDTGIADTTENASCFSRSKKHQMKSAKYVFRDEITALTQAGKTVVVYQHQQRKKNQVSVQLAEFAKEHKGCFALKFRPLSVRIYYVLPAPSHQQTLWKRTNEFLSECWKSCFELSSP
jgi:hypothetical protein